MPALRSLRRKTGLQRRQRERDTHTQTDKAQEECYRLRKGFYKERKVVNSLKIFQTAQEHQHWRKATSLTIKEPVTFKIVF